MKEEILLEQDFGFDPANGVTQVMLSPEEESGVLVIRAKKE